MDQAWRIELLGGLRVRFGATGEAAYAAVISRFSLHKAASLLAYLAYFGGRAHPRDRLIELFWPEQDLEAGRNSLRVHLTSLRRQLSQIDTGASLILADRSVVALRAGAFTTDVAEFVAAMNAAARASLPSKRAAHWEAAVALYGGELLPDSLDGWVLAERRHLAERQMEVLDQLTRFREQGGDLNGAIESARRALDADPLREESYFCLMRLYAAAGQPQAVLRQYQEMERVLRAELGETPSAEARALAEELRRDARTLVVARGAARADPPAASPPDAIAIQRPGESPSSGPEEAVPRAASAAGAPSAAGDETSTPRLPIQMTRFFGREEEITRLAEIFPSGTTRLVTLTGPGGSGKTRLAVAAARRLEVFFGAAMAFVPLADLRDAARIPDAIADVLGFTRSTESDVLEQVVAYLQGAHWLLVLDNYEHLVEPGALLLRRLLDRLPTLTCLVTSRQPLGLSGEQELAVLPLPTPRRTATPAEVRECPSVQLFADRARAIRSEFDVTVENAAAVATLCDRLDGLPLALELAGARAGVLTPEEMLEQLEQRFTLLVSRQRDLPTRHRSLRAAVETSDALLTPDLQRFFRRLSVFRGGWTLEAAAAVTALPTLDTLEGLERLRESSLILAEQVRSPPIPSGSTVGPTQPASAGTRYRMLETLREYSGEKLRERGEEPEARNRHFAYFLALAEATVPRLQGADPEGTLATLGAELDNFRAALAWAQRPASPPDASPRLAAALWPFWDMRGYHTEGREHLRAALSRPDPPAPDIPERAQLFLGAATLAFVQFEMEEARSLAHESLKRFHGLEDARGTAAALLLLGRVSLERGDEAVASVHLAEALEHSRQCGWTHGSALACVPLGMAVRRQGDRTQARALLEEGIKYAEAVGDAPFIAAQALHDLGCLAIETGDYTRAGPLLERSIEIWRHLEDRHKFSVTLRVLGELARLQGDLARAASHFEETASTCREQRNRTLLALALHELGNVFYEQGAYERARPAYVESVELFTQTENEWGMACTRANLGSTLFHLGDPAGARELYREALAIYQRIENPEGSAWTLERLGVVEARQGDGRKAVRLLGAAAAARERRGPPRDRWDQADWDEAVASLRSELSTEEFDAAWAEGRARTVAQTIDDALS